MFAFCGTTLLGQETPKPSGDESPRDLFQTTVGVTAADAAGMADSEAVLSRVVQMNHNLLTTVKPNGAINLNVLDDLNFVGVVDRIEKRGANRVTVAGKLKDLVNSSFTIILEKDAAVGVIRIGFGGDIYQIRYLGNGTNLISLIDSSLYPPEQCFETLAQAPSVNKQQRQEEEEAPLATEMSQKYIAKGVCQPPQTVWDILIPYTNIARAAMGGTNAAIAQCQLAVEVANDCYVNSLIPARLRLVHCYEVNYNEAGDMDDWLDWVTDSEAVEGVRDTYHADFVCMLVSGGSGLGWVSPDEAKAYSVAKYDRAVNTWTLAHEVGHNQGCDHNREDSSDDGFYTYSYGWYFDGDSDTQWGTVMSYIGDRIDHFSNPNVMYDGQPTGVTIGQTNESHNAHTINNRRTTCENFRTTRYDIWVDFAAGIPEAGVFSFPYDTLAEGVAQILVPGTGATEYPVLWVKAGTTNETITINKRMVIRSCGGSVTIGE